jgi:SET domain-containing protein
MIYYEGITLTYVEKSKIHGNGLFAKHAMKKGYNFHIILNRVTDEEYNKTGYKEAEMFLADEYTWDLRNTDYQYLNHSEKPNLDWYEDGERIRIEVLKDIEENEELTIHYGWDEDDFE